VLKVHPSLLLAPAATTGAVIMRSAPHALDNAQLGTTVLCSTIHDTVRDLYQQSVSMLTVITAPKGRRPQLRMIAARVTTVPLVP